MSKLTIKEKQLWNEAVEECCKQIRKTNLSINDRNDLQDNLREFVAYKKIKEVKKKKPKRKDEIVDYNSLGLENVAFRATNRFGGSLMDYGMDYLGRRTDLIGSK